MEPENYLFSPIQETSGQGVLELFRDLNTKYSKLEKVDRYELIFDDGDYDIYKELIRYSKNTNNRFSLIQRETVFSYKHIIELFGITSFFKGVYLESKSYKSKIKNGFSIQSSISKQQYDWNLIDINIPKGVDFNKLFDLVVKLINAINYNKESNSILGYADLYEFFRCVDIRHLNGAHSNLTQYVDKNKAIQTDNLLFYGLKINLGKFSHTLEQHNEFTLLQFVILSQEFNESNFGLAIHFQEYQTIEVLDQIQKLSLPKLNLSSSLDLAKLNRNLSMEELVKMIKHKKNIVYNNCMRLRVNIDASRFISREIIGFKTKENEFTFAVAATYSYEDDEYRLKLKEELESELGLELRYLGLDY